MPNKKPNVIFIVCDDMGEWAMGCSGHPNALTPNLDRLARDGTRLSNHFSASAVCSPSRACLLTGKYSLEVGIPDILCTGEGVGLDPKYTTTAKAFQKEGYRTALVGKWHLGDDDRYHPTQHGYDSFTGFRIGGEEGPLSSKDPGIEIDGTYQKVEGYTSDILTDHALDFIETKDSESPFFLSLHFWAPHANQGVSTEDGDRTWHPLKDEDWDPFKDLTPEVPNPNYPKLDINRIQRMTREYLASVHSVDRNIGRLIRALESTGTLDDTIIVFTSDNGYNIGHNGIWHKGNGWWILTDNRGDRPNLYDHSMRVPAIISYPNCVKAGQVCDHPNTSMDWFPTLMDFAGIKTKANWELRGESIASILKGERSLTDRPIFGQYQMWDWHQTGAAMRSWRTNEWKLMLDLKETVPNEFYDLRNDPNEAINIYNSEDPSIKAAQVAMERSLRKHITEVE
ncbi:sulfatase-like hydrolase/transferase [Coraliomargarita sp. SDUM461004]|uniref:Sulfatase-like hydrolase/transferase n=1 Tax=Thalassobacterium sedimentorum TaxID=3041258 RepID=A0ABU1AE97_9BACT|nr:sulfatase-like hydrolase/transferase [Coraliomargarita sp. SDUM461004]MDQ8192937.1 sulfatase-like hydrolase/transferase [Coraliomargarita sp. SDUM461004]